MIFTTVQSVHTRGLRLDWGWRYDLLVAGLDLALGGQLRAIRRRTLDLAQLQPGHTVLDVGCGTGTLALEAARRLGTSGQVTGIDPAPRQIARAQAKARRQRRPAGVPVRLHLGAIEQLAFADQSFDVVLSTWMMHHLPDDLKEAGLLEIARVLKAGGRLVVVDAEHGHGYGRPARLGAGALGIQALPRLLQAAGLSVLSSGQVRLVPLPGLPRAGFVVAQRPPDRAAVVAA